jgi:polyphenol oxidase
MAPPLPILVAGTLAGFRHGFTTRRGGVSAAPFATLNLGGAVGDDPAKVEENWARLARATGLAFARVRQVHGCRVVVAAGPGAPTEEADAVVSAVPGVAACVSVADCAPILLADPRSRAVAAVHAGWRGTLAGAAAAGVRALVDRHGARPGEVRAVVGPCIGPCCFEVSPELADRFRAEVDRTSAERRRVGSRVDLWRANELLLRAAGIARRNLEILWRCTSCDESAFFSHRRDRGATGRQVAFVAPDS